MFVVGKNVKWLVRIVSTEFLKLVFSVLLFVLFLTGNTIVCTLSQGTNREKYSYKIQHQRLKCQLWRGTNTFSSISSLMGHVLSIRRRKMDGPNPSEMDIKVPVNAPTSNLTNTTPFPNWKIEKINDEKLKEILGVLATIIEKWVNKKEIIITFMYISSYNSSLVFTLLEMKRK